MTASLRSIMRSFLPILFFASVGFFINFFWEMMQVPFFSGMSSRPHFTVVLSCTRAALGDVLIMMIAYGFAALIERDPYWLMSGRWRPRWLFIILGELITIPIEYWSIGPGNRWQYSRLMPVLPGWGIGVIPLLQWLIVPLIMLPACRWLNRGFLSDIQGGS